MNAHELFEHGFLLESGENSEKVEYFIIQPDIDGYPVRYQISAELYAFYAKEKAISTTLSNWDKNHRDMRELDTIEAIGELAASARALMEREQYVRDAFEHISLVLKTCTYTEQRRFVMKFIKGYTYAEIARSEGRSEASVKESVYKVLKKLIKL